MKIELIRLCTLSCVLTLLYLTPKIFSSWYLQSCPLFSSQILSASSSPLLSKCSPISSRPQCPTNPTRSALSLHSDKTTLTKTADLRKIIHPIPSLFPILFFSCLFTAIAPLCPPFILPPQLPIPAEQSAILDCILEGALRTLKYRLCSLLWYFSPLSICLVIRFLYKNLSTLHISRLFSLPHKSHLISSVKRTDFQSPFYRFSGLIFAWLMKSFSECPLDKDRSISFLLQSLKFLGKPNPGNRIK